MSADPATQTVSVEARPRSSEGTGGSPPVLLLGEILAERFRIVRGLGHGGMGQVYEAFDSQLGQSVALKVIRPELALLPGILDRFKTEVRLARQVTHPNVCRIFDIYQHRPPGQTAGLAREGPQLTFLTMELIRGRTLTHELREAERLRPADAAAILRQMAAALAAAHQAGIVHGDFKPGNVMLSVEDESTRVVVTDFGLACALTPEGESPRGIGTDHRGPSAMGTPAYMAPEQRAGAGASRQSDLYAFGLVAYEILTGRRFSVDSQPPSAPVGALPPNLETLVLRCLDPEPRSRPESARHLLDELTAAAGLRGWRPAVGRVLPYRPHWFLERKLGEGGFGEVWLARHRKTGEARVLKFCYDAERLAALRREVTLFRLLRRELGERDDINRVLDWNLDTEPYYLETEYTAGGDLRTWAEERGGITAIPRETRLEIAAQVAESLAAAHSIGVLHKDVKPANVLIDDRPEGPRARLADFGVGSALDRRRLESAGITILGLTDPAASAAGTGLYVAPELTEGRAPTVQADVYALGVMLYQMVVGDFSRALAPGWQRWVDDELLASDVGAAVDGIPEQRPGAREVADRLRRLEQRRAEAESHRLLRAQVESNRIHLARLQRRRRLLTWVLGATMVVALVMAWLVQRISKEATRARDTARLAIAVDQMDDDPTVAALALLEVENPGARAHTLMRQALTYPLARLERRFPTDLERITVSAEGGLVAASGHDGTVYLWSTGVGEGTSNGLRVLRGDQHFVTWIELHPDGRRLFTTSLDGTARIWDLEDDGPPVVLRGHEGRVWRAAFHPDGRRVVTPSEDYTARVWATDGRGEPVVLRGHRHWVIDARFSPDGSRIVTAGRDGTVRVWNADGSGEPIVLAGHTSWVFSATFSPDGRRIVSASRDGTARIWDVLGIEDPVVLRGHEGTVDQASFRPDGRQVVTSSQDGTVRTWSVDGSREKIILRGNATGVAEYTPGGDSILVQFLGGLRLVPSDGRGATLEYPQYPQRPERVAISADGRWLATAAGSFVRLWPVEADLWGLTIGRHPAEMVTLAPSQDGRWIATGTADFAVRLWSLDGDETIVLEGHEGSIHDVAFRPDGRQLASGSRDDTARLWSLDPPGESVVLRGHEGSVTALAYHPSGEVVATGSFDGTVRFWRTDPPDEAAQDRHLATVSVSAFIIHAVAFNSDGRLLATADDDQILRILAVETDAARAVSSSVVFTFDRMRLSCPAFDPAGRRLATVARPGVVVIWELSEIGSRPPRPARELDLEDPGITCARFDAAGRRLITASSVGTAKVVDLGSDAEPVELLGHDGPVTGAHFLPDGRAVTGSVDRTLRLWDADRQDPRAALARETRICLDPELRRTILLESEDEARRNQERCQREQIRRRPQRHPHRP